MRQQLVGAKESSSYIKGWIAKHNSQLDAEEDGDENTFIAPGFSGTIGNSAEVGYYTDSNTEKMIPLLRWITV
jgi:hypothetical protein